MPTSPVPEAYRNAVVAHIMIDGAAAAIDFYAEAFGAVELFRIDGPDGRVVHAEVGVAGSTIMLGDAEGPLFRAPTAAAWNHRGAARLRRRRGCARTAGRGGRCEAAAVALPTSSTATAQPYCETPSGTSGSSSRIWRT